LEVEKSIFREYDIRGIVGRELNKPVFELLGKSYGTYIQSFGSKKVIVGQDNRKSSMAFSTAFTKGLTSTGCDVIDVGVVVTPMLYFARKKWKINGGAIITASHNPSEYNGLKLTEGTGCIFGSEIQKIRELINSKNFLRGDGRIEKKDIVKEYVKMLKEKIKLKKQLKIVIDCGNGTASFFAEKIFKELGAKVITIFCDSDPNFPNHFPDPTVPENLSDLIKKVIDEKADLGVSFDGDADRIGVVDELGNILFGDQLMMLFSSEILQKNKGATIIVEVKCSSALIDDIKKSGGKVIMSATGHSIIEDKMHKTNALFAGEMSGHIYFGDEYYSFDDALYAFARLLRLLAKSDKKLSELFIGRPKYFNTPEIRIDCPETKKEEIVQKVKEYFIAKYPNSITIDGIRVVFEDGWALVRKSNTGPKLILRFESTSKKGLERIKEEVLEKLREFPQLQNLKI